MNITLDPMNITLTPVTDKTILSAVTWRLSARPSLRTPHLLTEGDQIAHFSQPNRNERFFTLETKDAMKNPFVVGLGGFTSIQWENRHAEISLILDPSQRNQGYGTQAVHALLSEAFLNMNLHHIYGECYYCSPALDFWKKIIEEYKGEYTFLPSRKFWNGIYYGAIYFTLYASTFMKGLLPHA